MSPLMFTGFQLKDREAPHQAIQELFQTIVRLRLRCTTLEIFGVITMGRYTFVRYRTDCLLASDLFKELLALGRGILVPDPIKGFLVKFPNGHQGVLNCTTVQAPALPGASRVYRGPSVKFWEKQFEDAPAKVPERILLMRPALVGAQNAATRHSSRASSTG